MVTVPELPTDMMGVVLIAPAGGLFRVKVLGWGPGPDGADLGGFANQFEALVHGVELALEHGLYVLLKPSLHDGEPGEQSAIAGDAPAVVRLADYRAKATAEDQPQP